MSELTALLELQELDNTLDQLRYRHEHLPERAELVAIEADLASLDRATASADATREELRRNERALEAEANDLEEKAARLDARLYDGSVTSPKEASVLTDEIAGLRGRQGELEERAIGVLVELEPLDAQLAEADAARGSLETRRTDAQGRLDVTATELEGEILSVEASRAEAAGGLEPSRLEQYRKLRITYGPSAVVEFDASRGGGCPVAMSAVELDRWKHLPAGTLEPCVDCGRLVAKLA